MPHYTATAPLITNAADFEADAPLNVLDIAGNKIAKLFAEIEQLPNVKAIRR